MQQDWPQSMGVYRVYSLTSPECFVGFSRNLRGTYKRLRFELKLNACSYQALQQFYNVNNGNVDYEILEIYTPAAALSEEEVDAHLQALVYKYKAALQGKLIQQQI